MKIITGGQTGADRAALDVALDLGLRVGGWVPLGRLAEDGRIADRYPHLVETDGSDPAERTRLNVRDSDATLIVSHGSLQGGSRLALEEAHRLGKAVLHLDVEQSGLVAAAAYLHEWLSIFRPNVLNVAGPRGSEDAEIYEAVSILLYATLRSIRTCDR